LPKALNTKSARIELFIRRVPDGGTDDLLLQSLWIQLVDLVHLQKRRPDKLAAYISNHEIYFMYFEIL
jgi:hypothetical protein